MSALESALLVMVVFLVLFVWCQSIRMDSLERRIDKTITRVSEVEGSARAMQEQQAVEPWWKDPRNFDIAEAMILSRAAQQDMDNKERRQ